LKIEYRIADQGRDFILGPDDLRRPFLIDPRTEHPHLTLLDYFSAIERFALQDGGRFLLSALRRQPKGPVRLDEIRRMVIHSEKHGAFHHVCRLELAKATDSVSFAVYTAVTERGRDSLAREFKTLSYLSQSFPLPYLPEVYAMKTCVHPSHPQGSKLLLLLAEWLEGYHEWHFHRSEGCEGYVPWIWDTEGGYRLASLEERFAIFRQASKILTLYYDVVSACRIHPWSHAAGDFVVKARAGGVDVRLSSARGYGPLLKFEEPEKFKPLIAFLYFFLELSIGMRLDRCEGTGEVVWAEKKDLAATITGFMEGMALKDEGQRSQLGAAGDPAAFLKGFASEELLKLCTHLKESYVHMDSETLALISRKLESHCVQLCEVIREVS
jgi:hypothetical protein